MVVVGAGAAGSLTALHLARTARRRGTPLDVVLLDPAAYRARGTAFGTTDEQHLLNVPAGGMSALPEEPGHFVAWRARQHPELLPEPGVFAPRDRVGPLPRRDPDLTPTPATCRSGCATCACAPPGVRRDGSGVAGHRRRRPGASRPTPWSWPRASGRRASRWAPAALRDSAFFVPDPWAPGALDVVRRDAAGPADVLLVGTGLTMVDVVLSLTRALAAARPPAPRRLAARRAAERATPTSSSSPRSPRSTTGATPSRTTGAARPSTSPGSSAPPATGVPRWTGCAPSSRRSGSGSTRATATEFLRVDASAWGRLRHRMPPESADVVAALERAGDR